MRGELLSERWAGQGGGKAEAEVALAAVEPPSMLRCLLRSSGGGLQRRRSWMATAEA